MINDDILVKYSIENLGRGFTPREDITNWVDYARFLNSQIREIRDTEFRSIGMDDLSIISPSEISPGNRILLSDYLDNNTGDIYTDHATILGIITRINPDEKSIIELEIEGIGGRIDLTRDPDRKLTWGTKIYPNLNNYHCILRLDTIPKPDGGGVYYYFNKYPRDMRPSWLTGVNLDLSKRAFIGILKNMSFQDLNDNRPRSQYMHFYRRNFEELCNALGELQNNGRDPGILKDIYQVYLKYSRIIKTNSKQLSSEIFKLLK